MACRSAPLIFRGQTDELQARHQLRYVPSNDLNASFRSRSFSQGYPVGGDSNYLQPNYDPNSMFGMGFDQDELASMSSASSPGMLLAGKIVSIAVGLLE